MTVISKVKWVLGILMVFVLIVATNLIDRDNFRRINDSVVAIYEDRLVVKNLVFEISLLIQEKEMAHALADAEFFSKRNKAIDEEIEGLIARYLHTKLTDNEARIFDDLQTNLTLLKEYEVATTTDSKTDLIAVKSQILKVKGNLYELSQIQLEEGRRQLLISQEAAATVELFTRLEIYFLIVLAVLVQIIVIYKPQQD